MTFPPLLNTHNIKTHSYLRALIAAEAERLAQVLLAGSPKVEVVSDASQDAFDFRYDALRLHAERLQSVPKLASEAMIRRPSLRAIYREWNARLKINRLPINLIQRILKDAFGHWPLPLAGLRVCTYWAEVLEGMPSRWTDLGWVRPYNLDAIRRALRISADLPLTVSSFPRRSPEINAAVMETVHRWRVVCIDLAKVTEYDPTLKLDMPLVEDLDIQNPISDEEPTTEIINFLGQIPSLKKLCLTRCRPPHWDSHLLAGLQHLKLQNLNFGRSAIAALRLLSACTELRALELWYTAFEEDEDATQPGHSRVIFPNLKTLQLGMPWETEDFGRIFNVVQAPQCSNLEVHAPLRGGWQFASFESWMMQFIRSEIKRAERLEIEITEDEDDGETQFQLSTYRPGVPPTLGESECSVVMSHDTAMFTSALAWFIMTLEIFGTMEMRLKLQRLTNTADSVLIPALLCLLPGLTDLHISECRTPFVKELLQYLSEPVESMEILQDPPKCVFRAPSLTHIQIDGTATRLEEPVLRQFLEKRYQTPDTIARKPRRLEKMYLECVSEELWPKRWIKGITNIVGKKVVEWGDWSPTFADHRL